MATTAFVTEYHSFMSFQCEASQPQLKSDQYRNYDSKMAPCENKVEELQKKDEDQSYIPTSENNHESSMSSMGASVESFSPEMNGDESKMSSDDSNGITGEQSIHNESRQNQDAYLSPMTQMRAVYEGIPDGLIQRPNHNESPTNSQNVSGSSMSPDQVTYSAHSSKRYCKCSMCEYVPTSEQDYNNHSVTHFNAQCSICNYSTRTKGRLQTHMDKFHSKVAPATWVGGAKRKQNDRRSPNDDGPSTSKGKSRVTRCKLCNFVGSSKSEYYRHLKTVHEKSGKLLECEQCDFVTNYKHHLEYHIRNHFGSKPFKCSMCNYSCVNKSMLNSHRKSHSNIYQFRCGGCSYATKYCHSLKMHLRKYNHPPGETLNPDGTPNTNSVIDVHGRRRGPKPKRRKIMPDSEINQPSTSAVTPSIPSTSYALAPPLPSSNPANHMYYRPQIFNNFAGSIFIRNPSLENPGCSSGMFPPSFPRNDNRYFRCPYCDFATESQDALSQHIFAHAATDNPDLMMRYNLNSDAMFQMHAARQFGYNNYPVNRSPYIDNAPRFESRNIEAPRVEVPTTVPNGDVMRPVNGSPVNNGNRSSGSPFRNGDLSFFQSSILPTPFSSNAPNNNQSDGSLDLRIDSNSTSFEPVNRRSSEPAQNNQALDLSLRATCLVPTRETSRVEDANPSSATNSNSSGQNGHFKPTARNRRKGKAFKLDHYMKEDDIPPASPSQDYWAVSPEESPAAAGTHQSDRLNNQQVAFQNPKTEPVPNNRPTCSADLIPSVVVKTEPADEDTETSGPSSVFRCHFCDLIFGEVKMYSTHMRYHTPGDPFTCGICGVKCYDRVTLFHHFTHTPHPDPEDDVCITGVVRH